MCLVAFKVVDWLLRVTVRQFDLGMDLGGGSEGRKAIGPLPGDNVIQTFV